MTDPTPETVLPAMLTQDGHSVYALSFEAPVLLVFLRHFGCTFCREALNDISKQRKSFADAGARVVMVHMTDRSTAEPYFAKYDLEGVLNVSDPDCEHYRAFGLLKGNFHQLFGLQSWIRGFEAGVVQGHWVGVKQLGDGFQMPGAFSIRNGAVSGRYIHEVASDRPDYWDLLSCCDAVS